MEDTLYIPATVDTLAAPAEAAVYGARAKLVAPARKLHVSDPRTAKDASLEGFLAMGAIFLFLVFFRYVRNFFTTLVTGLFSYRTSEKQFKNHSLSMITTNRILVGFSFLFIGFFCWLLWLRNTEAGQDSAAPWVDLLLMIGCVVAYFTVKSWLLRAIDYVGKSAPVMAMVIHFGKLYIIATGFTLFPVSLLMSLSGPGFLFTTLMTFGLLAAGLCLFLYLVRIVQIFFSERVSGFFLFLYLCTLEVAPFLVLYAFVLAS